MTIKSILFKHPWIILVAILAALGVVSSALLIHKFDQDLNFARDSANEQFKLIDNIVFQNLDTGNYQNINTLFRQWAETNNNIMVLRLDSANGFNLASYQRPASGKHILELKSGISYSYKSDATLVMRITLDPLYQRHEIFILQFASIFLAFSIMLALLLFFSIRSSANASSALRMKMLYRSLSEINQAIVRMEHQDELFPLVCRCAVEFGGMSMAWVGQLDEKSSLFFPVASYGNGLDYLENITKSSRADLPEGRGPMGTAYRENRAIIVNDYFADPTTAPWRTRVSGKSWNSAAAFPIPRGEQPFAVLSVYHAHAEAFDREAVELLSEMTRDIAFALDNFDREKRRKQVDAQLQENEHKFHVLFESTSDSMILLDMEGRIVDINHHGHQRLGYTKAEMLGRSVSEIDTPEFSARVPERIESIMRDGQVVFESAHVRKDGTIMPIEVNARLIELGGKKWNFTVIRDITERKRAEDEARSYQEHLEELVRRRTEELTIARDTADKSNQAKSEFLSSMSHELRTPMNAIIGFGELMQFDDSFPAKHRDSLQEILKAGEHLLALINEILDLARIESGHVDVSLEPVEVCVLIDECQILISPLARNHGITLNHQELEALDGLAVRADRTRLKQALLNLLSNAVKYNRDGGSVTIDVQSVGSERLRIRVSDTGNGIPAQRMKELFQPFSRLDAANSVIEGTGIGLTITRRIVEMMGGHVDAESQVGVGSTFWIELPLDDLPVADHEPKQDDANATGTTRVEDVMRENTVLYIEDNPSNQKLVSAILGQRKHIRLLTAHTAELGIELAMALKPGLILLDINMPGLNGYQALEILKADSRTRDIPVIAITANAMSGDIERGRQAGFTDYVTKPLNVRMFLQVVDEALSA